jgi:hypothetical protein
LAAFCFCFCFKHISDIYRQGDNLFADICDIR